MGCTVVNPRISVALLRSFWQRALRARVCGDPEFQELLRQPTGGGGGARAARSALAEMCGAEDGPREFHLLVNGQGERPLF